MNRHLLRLSIASILVMFSLGSYAQVTPATPIDLTIKPFSDDVINLRWRLSELQDSTNYVIERALSDSIFTAIDTLEAGNGVRYVDRTAPVTDSLLYRVRGFVESEVSEYSNIALLQRCPSNIPSGSTWTAVAMGQGITTQNNEVLIEEIGTSIYSVSDFSGLFFFNLDQLSPSLGGLVGQVPTIMIDMCGSVETLETSTGTDTQFGSAQGKGFYDANNEQIILNDNTGFIESVVFTRNVTLPVPNHPVSLRASQVSDNRIYLEWRDLSAIEDGFVIERAVGQPMNYTQVGTSSTDETTFVDEDPALILGETYYYRVLAQNSVGNSDFSDEAAIVTNETNYTLLINSPFQSLSPQRRVSSAAWADINDDGLTDLFTTTSPLTDVSFTDPLTFNFNDVLALNGGNSSFSIDETFPFSNNQRPSNTTSWTDINNDGLLDLFVNSGNDIINNTGGVSFLYLQEAGGQFSALDLGEVGNTAWGDLNNDGYLDFFDGLGGGAVHINNKDNTFDKLDIPFESSPFLREPSLVDYNDDGLLDIQIGGSIYENIDGSQFDLKADSLTGLSFWADLDQDGNIDLVNSNFILFNEGDGNFTQIFINELTQGDLLGINDYDNNGFDDLYIRIDRGLTETAIDREIVIMNNLGNRTFDPDPSSNQFPSSISRFVDYETKFADFDNDGFQDFFLVTNSLEQRGFLYRNNGGSNAFISIKLDGFASNDLGIGARITVETDNGTFHKQFIPSIVNSGGDDLRAHIGLGTASSINLIRVQWPSGQASEITGTAINQRITIAEEEVNLPPVLDDQSFEIVENSINDTPVGTVVATDRNVNDQLSFSIEMGNTEDAFAINEMTGEITVNNRQALDFETTPVFNLTISVSDGNGGSAIATVTINLIDMEIENMAPEIASQTFSVLENSASGTAVGTITASDADGDNLTFNIIDGNTAGTFALDINSGELSVADNALLDFDTNPNFTLTVAVDDGNGGMASATISINLEEEIVLSIDEESLLAITLYPNPADDIIYVEAPNFGGLTEEITLTDLSGRIQPIDIEVVDQYTRGIRFGDVKTGIYIVTLKVDQTTVTRRFVKK